MDKESFNILLEIQSSSRKIEEIEQKINDENFRITFVERNCQKTLHDIEFKRFDEG